MDLESLYKTQNFMFSTHFIVHNNCVVDLMHIINAVKMLKNQGPGNLWFLVLSTQPCRSMYGSYL